MTMPGDEGVSKAIYLKPRGYSRLRPGQLSYWQKYPKFFVSFLKSMNRKEAASDNDFRYAWLPKLDLAYDVPRVFELIHRGSINGNFCQGFNPLMAFPNIAYLEIEGTSGLVKAETCDQCRTYSKIVLRIRTLTPRSSPKI